MRWRLGLIFGGIMVMMAFAATPAAGQQPSVSQKELEDEVIAEINDWRIEEGLWPLQVNDTLRAMAFDQATYLLTTDIPEHGGDFHINGSGDYPRGRGVKNPYNWPTYGAPEVILVGENVGVGTVAFSVNYWQNSPIHAQATTNPDYREVGVAALPVGNGDDVFVVVFGGRPNVLPVEYNPVDNTLFLSNDSSRYAPRSPNWISNATTIQFLDANSQPMSEPQPWQLNIPVPANMPGSFIVRFSDGRTQVDTPVNLATDVVMEVVGGQVLEAANEEAVLDSADVQATTQIISPISEMAESEVLAQYPNQDVGVAADLVNQMNELRMKHHIWPLAHNATLEAIALRQANYLLTETDVEEVLDLHADADYNTVHQRAEEAPFLWPHYGDVRETEVEENIAVGDTVFAMRFWRQSAQDHLNMINAEYREVGVAALPYKDGQFVMVAVFGSRPNVLPAFFATNTNTLLLSDELSPYGGLEAGFIGPITRIRLFDGAGRPLTDGWLSWHEAIQLPAIDSDRLFVLYSDGRIDILSEVDLQQNSVTLPDDAPAPVVLSSASPAAAVTATPVNNSGAFLMATNTPSHP